MTSSSFSFTHYGSWDDSTREIPALAFIEKYSDKVDALEISGPFFRWYAQSCNFYNTDGVVYRGGDAIWTWMQKLFRAFSAVHHKITLIRLFNAVETEMAPERAAQWVILEAQTAFTMKGQPSAFGPITVPRLLMFLVGKSEVKGEGTDGLQILEAKAWWDSGELERQSKARREQQI